MIFAKREYRETVIKLIVYTSTDSVLQIATHDALIPTDHSREYIPLVVFGRNVKGGKDFGTRESFADIAQTILSYFGLDNQLAGEKIAGMIKE